MISATLACVIRLSDALTATQPQPLAADAIADLCDGAWTAPPPARLIFDGLAYDSRRVVPGALFVALRGEKVDGHAYRREAWERGARGLVCEQPDPQLPVPQLVVPDTRRALSRLSDAAFGFPARKLEVIGITGTKGKTSTTYFLRHLLDTGGQTTGVIGTLGWHACGETVPLPLTTPESYEVHQLLATLRTVGCSHVAMEASAHGMHFQRTRDVRFARALFSNLAQDHLDFFGTMERYAAAKRTLFTEQLPEHPESLAILNIDDSEGTQLLTLIRENPVLTVGSRPEADIRGQVVESRSGGLRLKVTIRDHGDIDVLVPLGGTFFATNLLLAIATAHSYAIDLATIASGLATMPPVPGRHEVVSTPDDDLQVIVDYAHTPASVAAILATVERDPARPIIALVGCGGDRDRTKRPQMGRLAYEGADQLIVTSDNPRSEDPDLIIAEILAGIPGDAIGAQVSIEPDRAQAIAQGIATAPSGARIFILGKGHEPYQILRDRTIDFDDREHARRALQARRLARAGAPA